MEGLRNQGERRSISTFLEFLEKGQQDVTERMFWQLYGSVAVVCLHEFIDL